MFKGKSADSYLTFSQNEPFFIYTGRGPSSDSMHIGHTQVFDFVKCVMRLSWIIRHA